MKKCQIHVQFIVASQKVQFLHPSLFRYILTIFRKLLSVNLLNCEVIQFEDDKVIFVSDKDLQSKESVLNKYFKNVPQFSTENKLIKKLESL